MRYADKFKDPRWQKKRLRILERDNWACQMCVAKHKSLHVHHLFYIKDIEPWEYEHRYLITLCDDCHKAVHKINFKNEIVLKEIYKYSVSDIANLLSMSTNSLGYEDNFRIEIDQIREGILHRREDD